MDLIKQTRVNLGLTRNETKHKKKRALPKIKIESKTSSDLISRNYYVRPEQDQALDMIKEKTGYDKSQLLRLAIDYLIENCEIK